MLLVHTEAYDIGARGRGGVDVDGCAGDKKEVERAGNAIVGSDPTDVGRGEIGSVILLPPTRPGTPASEDNAGDGVG